MDVERQGPVIGLLNEKPLHAELKRLMALPGDLFETKVDRYVVDIVRHDMLLEIQTAGFGAMRAKLRHLLKSHRVRLIHPIAAKKWIVRQEPGRRGESSRRKSPLHGRPEDAFRELVSIPDCIPNPRFSLQIVMTHEEEQRRHCRFGPWRRKGWRVEERRLVQIAETKLLTGAGDWLAWIPAAVPDPFTTRDLAEALGIERFLAQKMAYCYCISGLISRQGKQGHSHLYRRAG